MQLMNLGISAGSPVAMYSGQEAKTGASGFASRIHNNNVNPGFSKTEI